MNIRLYSRFGRILTFIVILLLASAVILIATNEGIMAAVSAMPFAATISWITLLLFWFPELLAQDSGITVRNVWSEYVIPWESIQRIDTKYALTLITDDKTVSVWSAPAPGRHSVFKANREQGRHLPESTYLAGTIRPGDLPQSESGSAAAIVRREWERRRDSGFTPGPTRVSQRFRIELGVVSAILVALLTISLAF